MRSPDININREELVVSNKTRVPLMDALHMRTVDEGKLAQDLSADGNSGQLISLILSEPDETAPYI